MTFVRGKGNYVPFRPGGLDEGAFAGDVVEGGEEETEEERARRELEEEEAMGKTWKTIAPGMRRGLKLDGGEAPPHYYEEGSSRLLVLVFSGRVLAICVG